VQSRATEDKSGSSKHDPFRFSPLSIKLLTLVHSGPICILLTNIELRVVGALFIIGWNIVWTSLIMCFIKYVLRIPLRMSEDELLAGDDAIHGEAAYVLAGELGMGGAIVGHDPHAIAPVAGEESNGNGGGSQEIKQD
jgi:hypothetical protein